MVVLVTGGNGQLGQSIQFIANNYPNVVFHFYDSTQLNVSDFGNCQSVFNSVKPDYCINAAAYTAVDKAESEPEKAYLINVTGAKNIAKVCNEFNTTLLHISTDFVFDGKKTTPYTEEDAPNPTGVYGQTKLEGEKAVQSVLDKYFIIRTSWVYSQFGNNFKKTMLRLGVEKTSLSVVNDQIGTPTNAVDLAHFLTKLIIFTEENPVEYGIYNFSNEGQCSWYDFAKKIFEIHKIEIDLHPIPTSSYPTAAKRPLYSVLDKHKIKKVFSADTYEVLDDWQNRLKTNE